MQRVWLRVSFHVPVWRMCTFMCGNVRILVRPRMVERDVAGSLFTWLVRDFNRVPKPPLVDMMV
jgi:hypothetical protein